MVRVLVAIKQTDRQTNFLTPYMGGGCGFFLSVKFDTSLLTLLTEGLLKKYIQNGQNLIEISSDLMQCYFSKKIDSKNEWLLQGCFVNIS